MVLSRIEDFDIKRIDMNNLPDELLDFTNTAGLQGMVNNASVAAMKIGKWGDEAWWATWYQNTIISVSGCHKFSLFELGCWRLMVRTATLKGYRGRAPGSIKTIKTDFNWGHILPHQIEYATQQGASRLVFTTNSTDTGESNSLRTNNTVKKVLEPQGLVKLIATDVIVFGTKQNVWEIVHGTNVD